ncbi:MAG: hypothetical protein V1874_17845 [Spirochaetota bacterium]
MAKTFDLSKMKRGKSLSEAAENIENMSEETSESIDDLLLNPHKEKVTKAVAAIRRDPFLVDEDKNKLLSTLRSQFAGLFNLNNCPNDYESLKLEAVFLADLMQVSFVLLGQRLLKIRDNELYLSDGYKDFKTFVEKEIKIGRTTAYNYIDLVSCFGVQALEHGNVPDPSKLIPLLPVLKANREDIPTEDIKSEFIKKAKTSSFRDLKGEIKQLKIQYGLAKEPDDIDRLDRAFNILMTSFPAKLTAADKKKIRDYVKKLNSLLDRK